MHAHTWRATAHIEGADSLWAVQLVARDGHGINVHLVHVDGKLPLKHTKATKAIGSVSPPWFVRAPHWYYLANHLGGVSVKDGALCTAHGSNVGNGLEVVEAVLTGGVRVWGVCSSLTCSTPISLFTAMTDTRQVSSLL